MNIEKYKIGQQVAICGFIEEINIENLRDIENTTHLVINTLTRTIGANPKYETVITDLNWEADPYLLGYDTLTDLIAKINKWAISHGLDKGDPKIEWMKVTEEVGEIRDVFLKPNDFDDPEMALKDAIGDSIVTLVVLCLQLGYDVKECLKIAYNNIKDRKGVMIDDNFVKTR